MNLPAPSDAFASPTGVSRRVTPEVHKPYDDDGLTYCGWDGHDGCGHVWPCPTVRSRRGAEVSDVD